MQSSPPIRDTMGGLPWGVSTPRKMGTLLPMSETRTHVLALQHDENMMRTWWVMMRKDWTALFTYQHSKTEHSTQIGPNTLRCAQSGGCGNEHWIKVFRSDQCATADLQITQGWGIQQVSKAGLDWPIGQHVGNFLMSEEIEVPRGFGCFWGPQIFLLLKLSTSSGRTLPESLYRLVLNC